MSIYLAIHLPNHLSVVINNHNCSLRVIMYILGSGFNATHMLPHLNSGQSPSQALKQGLRHLGSQISPLLPPSVGNCGPLGAGNSRAHPAAPSLPPSTGRVVKLDLHREGLVPSKSPPKAVFDCTVSNLRTGRTKMRVRVHLVTDGKGGWTFKSTYVCECLYIKVHAY